MILNSSFLLLILVGTVTSDPSILNIIPNSYGYKLSTDLRGIYSQQQPLTGGYHKAEVHFTTKVPSLNPDQAGVNNIECKDDKIILSLNDGKSIEQINQWPDKVMLLISHKWECFGESSTQFFMVGNKTIDDTNNLVAFDVQGCDITDWADDFLIDLSWVKGNTKRRRRGLDRREPFEGNTTISLNVLFNETTGKSSQPNIPLIDDTLFCSNCFVNGEATIALRLAATFPFKLTDATISLNGNIKLNLDFTVNNTEKADTITSPDFTLLSIPLPPGFRIPNLFSIGPSIDLVASASITANATGSVTFGGEVALPKFNVNATFVNDPTFEQSGFVPQAKLHDLNSNFTIDVSSVNITGTLKPQLAFGLNALGGLVSQKVGFGLVANFDNNLSNINSCEGKRLITSLNSNLGFFFNSDNFPVAKFPPKVLLDKCV